MLHKRFTTLSPSSAAPYPKSRCLIVPDGQRFDHQRRRAVGLAPRTSQDRDIGYDQTRNAELGIFEPGAHPLRSIGRIQPGDSKSDLVTLPGECQRLPVDRFDVGKENPISLHSGARDERSDQSPGGL